ncbi:transposase [Corynebacterium sp. c9Ua_112]|uniref:Transposase n=2 Tax=Corynebacterium macclintockiae TaxID=2913501 RepID=A0A9X3RTY5_9CORY|nr:transposase [Corynebacterium macclintockiae]
MTNYYASKTGRRKGRAMGKPQRKTHRSRKSVTIHPDSRMGPKGCPPPRGQPQITGYKHLYLANLFSHASKPDKKDRILRVRVHGSTRRLVKALQNHPDAKISNFTISQKGGYWYVAVMVKSAQRQPSLTRRQKQADTLGIDIGIHNYLSLSDGSTVIQLPPLLQRNIKRSKNLRKKLARSQKGSNRRRKLIATIKRVDHELKLQRDGFVHQITAELARNYALIGIEDLNVKGMTRSARGTVDAPGTNVRAKSSLNRRMLEGIPGEFRRQLEYKTKRTGAALEVIDRFYPSSKTCSRCGWKNENLSLSNRQFTCLECGLSLDRDHNAALNIAAEAERKHLKDTKSPKPSHD